MVNSCNLQHSHDEANQIFHFVGILLELIPHIDCNVRFSIEAIHCAGWLNGYAIYRRGTFFFVLLL